MDYYGLLFLYYLKGLSGKSVLRLFFNVEVGGTEQLLPENTSTPTTTPILADIQYPDGLRTDQYFTYRETPTTVSNKARIKTIKGNTLVWNQLVQNGNFAGTSKWYAEGGASISVSNNIMKFVGRGIAHAEISVTNGHKYLYLIDVKIDSGSAEALLGLTLDTEMPRKSITVTSAWATYYMFGVATSTSSNGKIQVLDNRESADRNGMYSRNAMLIDLAQIGLDSITDPSDFTSLFSLPYYDFNQGSLLSFNGNGIKTTGKNLCPKFTNGTGANLTYTVGDDGSVKVTGTNTGTAFYAIPFTLPAGTYVLSGAPTNGQFTIRNAQGGGAPSSEFSGQLDDYGSGATFTVSATATAWLNIRSTARTHDDTYYPMIRYADADDTYEPYTSSTLSLPISTYFPTGMKDVPDRNGGKVYDELTNSKAITRVGSRAYQSGDEDDTSVITDGTTTYYALATPIETPITTEDANEALSLLMGKSVSSNNANQLINIITKGE